MTARPPAFDAATWTARADAEGYAPLLIADPDGSTTLQFAIPAPFTDTTWFAWAELRGPDARARFAAVCDHLLAAGRVVHAPARM